MVSEVAHDWRWYRSRKLKPNRVPTYGQKNPELVEQIMNKLLANEGFSDGMQVK